MRRHGASRPAVYSGVHGVSDKSTIRNFRTDCLRELKKIKDAWPDLHYHTVTGALVLSPSPPRTAPSQLRLVE